MSVASLDVNEPIRAALRDAAPELRAKGVLVVEDLTAKGAPAVPEDALREALYTLFRVLPIRLARGTIFYVGTQDRAGGDIEVTWEAREDAGATAGAGVAADVRSLLASGPHGDVVALAVHALERVCRTRAGFEESEPPPVTTSSALAEGRFVRRRVSALIPGAHTDKG